MNNSDNRNPKPDLFPFPEQEKRENPSLAQQKGERSSAPDNAAGSGDSRQAKINLPVGGGAIRGIGEKFQANPVTGTASFSVPLTISEGRGKFTPQLALSYDSGSGNSVFGLGWNVAVPSITRKTDKGLPKYDDNPANESDTFILSGAEDLVPVVNSIGVRISREEGNYIIYTYQPRTEGLFALIERWVNKTTHISHWRSISKENITSVYGLHESTRIYDPDNTLKIFSWLLEESWDAKGNLMRFAYKREDGAGVSSSCYEKPRLAKAEFANTYLKSVFYGNNTMCSPSGCESNYNGDFHFTLVFDYGDYSASNPQPTWTAREDAFSNNKAGFEIRTYRLCRRVLMFHTFTELGSQPVLVRSTDFEFELTAMFSLLQGVTHKSYQGVNSASFPPLTFNYTQAMIADTFKEVPEEMLRQLPAGVDGQNYQWADLYSEGVSGILSMNNQSWYFMPNYGDKQYLDDEADSTPVFGGMHSEVPKPAAVQQRKASFRLNDIDSDGYPELVIQGEGINGFYSRDEDGKWLDFRSFASYPNINFNNANLRFMDLTGDGSADILISKGEQFDIYFSEGKKGYGHYKRVRCSEGEGNAPKLVFSDPRQRIFLADMDGDGLTDIVRISNQSIVYWANRGYGIFSDAVVMSNPPLLDSLEAFDSRFVHLVDVDGTGTADLLYISNGAIRYFQNRSGNAWAEITLPTTIRSVFSKQHYIQTSDLLGNGTQCVVFTTSLPDKAKCMRYWELTSGIKPFLLKEINNNMGGLTRLCYAPSTKFYMQDKLKGRPWITKLPFPVHVLEKVEIIDLVSEKCFTNRYAYHHGYYDPVEREFRGFGMVEQWDTESPTQPPQGGGEESPPWGGLEGYVPPVYTKTWFHTGFFKNREEISRYYEEAYYQGDSAAWKLPDTVIPDNLTAEEAREACRALRGSPLRVEIYALDGSDQQHIPYTVEEKNYGLQCLQATFNNKHAIFLKTESEQLMYHYERIAADPRIAHKIVLETDAYGNALKTVQIAYPRRTGAIVEQITLLMTYQAGDFINAVGSDYRWIGIPYQSKQYQIHGFTYSGGIITKALCVDIPTATEIDYAETPTTGLKKRLLQHQRTTFWNTALTDDLPLGQIAVHGLPYQQQQLELTQTLLNSIDSGGTKYTVSILTNECKYLQENTNYFYAQGEIQRFSSSKFYQPVETEDAFGNKTELDYDNYNLFIHCITDALGNDTQASYDYRVLQPYIITDPNGNSQSVAFDVLGMVIKKAVAGKNGEGDTLNDPTETYSYDLQAWINNDKPVYAHVSKREKHADAGCRWLQAYVYTDGLGNEIMTKTQAADGLAWTMQGGVPVEVQTNDRWLASGKIILNNKGKAVKQYEPWYSTTYEFEDEELLTNYGVTPVMHYDPLSRLIQTDFPDNTTARVEFDVWQQRNHDQNDCDTSSAHYNTPQVIDLDVLGRAFQINDDNGNTTTHEFYTTHNQLDITGRIVQVTDALERIMTVNVYALSEKHQLKVQNIDSATRWMLNDTLGNPRYVWDSRDHRIKTLYDALLRPTQMLLKTGNNPEIITQQIIYGTSSALNNIGQIIEIDAQDGKTSYAYDFKGNLTEQQKQFAQDYQNELDWSGTVTLINEIFTTQITSDALNRPVTITQPDSTIISNVYAKGGLLQQVASTGSATVSIQNITYNPRGQREDIYYGNNTKTKYYYNPLNFRITRILTTRNTGQDILQDLNYTYDAVGNIVGQTDNAQQTFYFNNSVVSPTGTYTYDALYRLLTATGREQTALAMPNDADFVNNIPCPDTETTAMQNYTHNYQYDELGNILQMQSVGNWTRNYVYNNSMTNNYLLGHGGGTVYTYDAHGNMLTMPHLTNLVWDYLDQLHCAANGTFTSYYNYDAEGNRSRKVVLKNNIREERYYMGDYEVYRKYINNVIDTERTTVNISDDEKRFAIIDTLTVESGEELDPYEVTIRYQYDNHLGSACLELDDTGQIISYEEYHPFGTTSYRSGRTETEVSLKRYKYCGKERDEETGLYYYGIRYYAAWICRFISVDILQFDYPQLTPYNYSGNKPITHFDIDGLQSTGDEKRGEVINVHKAEMEKQQEIVNQKQSIVDDLIKNLVDKKDKTNYKEYKDRLKKAKNDFKKANNILSMIKNKYQQVEDFLNEYAYYDPEGYEELHKYVDYKGNPINVYVEISDDLTVKQDVGQLPYGDIGRLKADKVFYNTNDYSFMNIKTEKFGMNSVIIQLAAKGFASTISHEKGHFESYYYDYKKDREFVIAHKGKDLKLRHLEGDPSGKRADQEEADYNLKKQNVIKTKGYFNKDIHKRTY